MRLPHLSALCILLGLAPLIQADALSLAMQKTRKKETEPVVDLAPEPIAAEAAPAKKSHPPTIDYPDRRIRYITVAEAFTIALERGDRGKQTVSIPIITGEPQQSTSGGRAASVSQGDLDGFGDNPFNGDDAIRAFALPPAIITEDIKSTLAKFDANLITSLIWSRHAVGEAASFPYSDILSYGFSDCDRALFSCGVFKPWTTGGFATAAVATNHSKVAESPSGFAVISPACQPRVDFCFEQHFLPDFGIEIDRSLAALPVNQLQPDGGRLNGILIQRVRASQLRPEFERSVNVMLFNAENAYWGLYANYCALNAQEQGMRQASIAWETFKARRDAGKNTGVEMAQARAAFIRFRQERIDALQRLIESERRFRDILGLPLKDGDRLVPAEIPTLVQLLPDWKSSLDEAIANRPELVAARQDVKDNQMKMAISQNNTVDFRSSAPPGSRNADASKSAAKLNLARSLVVLKNQELKAERFLEAASQNMARYHRDIESCQRQRRALGDQLKGLHARLQAGNEPLIAILSAQSQFADALANEYAAIANYNSSLAAWEYAMGTIQHYDNVSIVDGPLRNCILPRAEQYYREQGKGVVARARATLPSSDRPLSLASLLQHAPPIPDMPGDMSSEALPPADE